MPDTTPRIDRITIRVHQQMALGGDTSEEPAVPVLVGDLGDEVVDGLRVVRAQLVTQCPAMV